MHHRNMLNLEKLEPMPNAPQMYPQVYPQVPMLSQQQQQQLQMQPPQQLLHQNRTSNEGVVYQLPPDVRPNNAGALQAATPANVIMVSNSAPLPLGHEPQCMTCPRCNVKMLTRLEYRCTYRTHLIAFAICLTGLFCLVPLPYCLKSFKNSNHYCSNCDQFLGFIKM